MIHEENFCRDDHNCTGTHLLDTDGFSKVIREGFAERHRVDLIDIEADKTGRVTGLRFRLISGEWRNVPDWALGLTA